MHLIQRSAVVVFQHSICLSIHLKIIIFDVRVISWQSKLLRIVSHRRHNAVEIWYMSVVTWVISTSGRVAAILYISMWLISVHCSLLMPCWHVDRTSAMMTSRRVVIIALLCGRPSKDTRQTGESWVKQRRDENRCGEMASENKVNVK